MTEPVEEPPPEQAVPAAVDPVEADDPMHEVARKNAVLGWGLFGLFVLLFAGTWAVAFIYLSLD